MKYVAKQKHMQKCLATARKSVEMTDFSVAEANTLMGKIGVKVWIYKQEAVVEKIQEEDNSVLDISAISSTLDDEGVIDASAK